MSDKIVQSTLIQLTDIEPNRGQIDGLPKNPRLIKNDKFRKLKQSIQEDPEMLRYRELLVYPYDGKYIIIGGNMRYAAMKELGITEAPCKVIDKDATLDQLKAYTIKDNSSFGEWDYEMLANEWDAPLLTDWGLDIPEIKTELEEEKEVEEDDFDEEIDDVPPISKLGDIYQLGDHRLMCGDSTKKEDVEKLMAGEIADMVFTDPPYGVSYVGTNNPNGKEWKMIENDNLRGDRLYLFLEYAFKNIATFLKPDGAFYIWFASSNHIQFETAINAAGLRVKQELIWDKGMVLGHSDYHWAYEPCLYGCHTATNCKWHGNRAQKTFLAMNRTEVREMTKEQMQHMLLQLHEGNSCWRIKRDAASEYVHPTQKPTALAGRALHNSTDPMDIVLDLFGGSGSTLMACEQLGRKARLMEFDPHYCDVIIARWEKYTGKKAVKVQNND